MEQYYIATAEGKTEGPYSFENLEVQCNCGMISSETLVCVAGGQEWTEFKTILSQKGKGLPNRHKVEEIRKKLYDPAWASSSKENIRGSFLNEREEKRALLKIQKLNEQMDAQSDAERFLTVEDIFRIVGIIALIIGFILALCHTGQEYGTISFIYLVSGVFSCLGCFWCAKVVTLLSRAVNVLSALDKKLDSFFNKE